MKLGKLGKLSLHGKKLFIQKLEIRRVGNSCTDFAKFLIKNEYKIRVSLWV